MSNATIHNAVIPVTFGLAHNRRTWRDASLSGAASRHSSTQEKKMKISEWKMLSWLRAQCGQKTKPLPAVEVVCDENSVVVVKSDHWLSTDSALRMKRIVESAFNSEGRAVLVLDGGMDIAVFRKEPLSNNNIVITRNAEGEIVMVSRQDEDGEVQDVIAAAYTDGEREAYQARQQLMALDVGEAKREAMMEARGENQL
jgi:hypothetical protein